MGRNKRKVLPAETVREAVDATHLTRAVLASEIGVDQTTISRWRRWGAPPIIVFGLRYLAMRGAAAE